MKYFWHIYIIYFYAVSGGKLFSARHVSHSSVRTVGFLRVSVLVICGYMPVNIGGILHIHAKTCLDSAATHVGFRLIGTKSYILPAVKLVFVGNLGERLGYKTVFAVAAAATFLLYA